MSNLTNVFVYGSLKQGFGNHVLLDHVEKFKDAVIKGWNMYSLCAYPAIVPAGDDREVTGEVYQVDDATLEELNWLEGYGSEKGYTGFYDRTEVTTEEGDTCFVYFFHDAPMMT